MKTFLTNIALVASTLVSIGVLIGMLSGYFDFRSEVKAVQVQNNQILNTLNEILIIKEDLVVLQTMHGLKDGKNGHVGQVQSQTNSEKH